MKFLLKTAIGALVLGLIAVTACQSAQPRSRPSEPRGQIRMFPALESLNLTEQQKAKIQKIREQTRQKLEQIRSEATNPEERREKARAVLQEAREQISNVLTPEQRAKWAAATARFRRGIPTLEELSQQLRLTEEQRKKLKPILDRYTAEARKLRETQPPSPETREKMRALRERFNSEVEKLLTPQQRSRFRQLRPMAFARPEPPSPLGPLGNVELLTRRLNLSPDQQEKVRRIVENARDSIQKEMQTSLGPKARENRLAQLRRDTAAKIRALLNEQQKQIFDRMALRTAREGGRARAATPPNRSPN